MSTLSRQDALNEMWRRGSIYWKLDAFQMELYKLYKTSPHKIQTWLLSRRSGKSFAGAVLAIEQCIKKPNSIVKFVSPTKLQCNLILRPLFRKILSDCPKDIAPEFREKDYIFYFPNGSEIQLAGTDSEHAEKLRGGDADFIFVDEAGSCSKLDYVITSILIPTTFITKGKVILASTPPIESEHDFLTYIERAEQNGTLIKKTIYENPRLTKEDIEEAIRDVGGVDTDAYKRELMCQIIKDSTTVVLPEFTEELEKKIVKDWPRPPHFEAYEAMDLGGKDLTVVLFGYHDFRADKVIIEDEVVVDFRQQGNNIGRLVELIKEKEKILWYNTLTNEQKKPYLRISDINYIVTQEISKISNHEVNFQTTKKDDPETAINNLRVLLNAEKIIIHPRCITLLRHLRHVKWSSKINKAVFARSGENGHYDAVSACIYLVRNIVFTKNPYPDHYGINMKDLYVNNPRKFGESAQVSVYRKIFGLRDRR